MKWKFWQTIDDSFKASSAAIREYKSAQKSEKTLRVRVKLVDNDENYIQTTRGILSENHNFLFVPYMHSVFMEVKPINEDGVRTVYVSKKYHKTLDMRILSAFASARKFCGIFKIPISGQIKNIQFADVTGSIDFKLFDNHTFSSSFAKQTHEVLSAKTLQILMTIPQRQYLLSMVISGLFGIILGVILDVFLRGAGAK